MRLTTLPGKVVAAVAAAGTGLVLLLGAGPVSGSPQPAGPVVLAECTPSCPPSGDDDTHWG
jgi:hypothetical protein